MDYKNRKWAECVGIGWRPMIEELIKICKAQDIQIMQVKEKLGGLRFYVYSPSKGVRQLIWAVEKHSYCVCERCGEQGKLREDRNWLKTLCDSCNESDGKRLNNEL